MKTSIGAALIFLLIVLAGCATGSAYQPVYTPYGYSENDPNYVPPSFYDYNPQLQQWYTPPYWNPDRM